MDAQKTSPRKNRVRDRLESQAFQPAAGKRLKQPIQHRARAKRDKNEQDIIRNYAADIELNQSISKII